MEQKEPFQQNIVSGVNKYLSCTVHQSDLLVIFKLHIVLSKTDPLYKGPGNGTNFGGPVLFVEEEKFSVVQKYSFGIINISKCLTLN